MQIIHRIDDFLYSLFPGIERDDEQGLLKSIESFYSFGSTSPKVSIKDNFVIIEIDIPNIVSREIDFKKVVSFCEQGKYSDAKPILENLIIKNPTVSEYHRIMGQILSDEVDQDGAINCLIDALR